MSDGCIFIFTTESMKGAVLGGEGQVEVGGCEGRTRFTGDFMGFKGREATKRVCCGCRGQLVSSSFACRKNNGNRVPHTISCNIFGFGSNSMTKLI